MLQTVHDGEKNFNCNSCDKIFAQSGDLKKQERQFKNLEIKNN